MVNIWRMPKIAESLLWYSRIYSVVLLDPELPVIHPQTGALQLMIRSESG